MKIFPQMKQKSLKRTQSIYEFFAPFSKKYVHILYEHISSYIYHIMHYPK